jgi:hypothetical protein
MPQRKTTRHMWHLTDTWGRSWQFLWDENLSYRFGNQIPHDPDPWTPVRWHSDGTPAKARTLRAAQLSTVAWLLAIDEICSRGPEYIGPKPRPAMVAA